MIVTFNFPVRVALSKTKNKYYKVNLTDKSSRSVRFNKLTFDKRQFQLSIITLGKSKNAF